VTLVTVNPKYLKDSYMLFQQILRGKKINTSHMQTLKRVKWPYVIARYWI